MNCWQTLPEKFIKRIQEIIPSDEQRNVLESFCQDKPVTIRVNTLKTDKQKLKEILTQHNIQTDDILWYNNALIITSKLTRMLTDLDIYNHGLFYIQNLSSMLPALILDPKEGEMVLDIAAAPGSKTTQMAQMMNNKGNIVANDISKQRIYKMRIILEQQGVSNVRILQIPGEHIWKKYPNYFDKVLVDAPCTMEGRFKALWPDTFKDWSTKKIKVLSYLQKRLLRSAFYATKPGGIIVYATCTLEPEENEEIIDWLLNEEKEHVSVENISINGLQTEPSLISWKNKIFHEEIKRTLRILPSKIMEGFYVAKLRRIN